MKLSFQKNDLLSTLQVVGKAVASKTTLSIMECILVDATEGQIRLTGNKNDFGIESICPGDILEPGKLPWRQDFSKRLLNVCPRQREKIFFSVQRKTEIVPFSVKSPSLKSWAEILRNLPPFLP